MHALDRGCHRGRTAVSGLDHIAPEEVGCGNRAPDGGHADGLALNAQLVDRFGDKAVNDAVRTSGAIVRYDGKERMGALEDDLFFGCHGFKHLPFR